MHEHVEESVDVVSDEELLSSEAIVDIIKHHAEKKIDGEPRNVVAS